VAIDWTTTRREVLPILWLVLWLGWSLPALGQEDPVAAPPPAGSSLADQEATLARERAALEKARAELDRTAEGLADELSALTAGDIGATDVDQARVDLESQRLSLENLQAEIENTERRLREREQTLTELRAREQLLSNPARTQTPDTNAELEATRQAIQEQQSRLALERESLAQLREQQALLDERLELARSRLERLQELYLQQQQTSRVDAQQTEETRLRSQARRFLERAASLRQRLAQGTAGLSPALRNRLETEVTSTEEMADLTELAIRLGAIDTTLDSLAALAGMASASPTALAAALERQRAITRELADAADLLERKQAVLEEQLALLEQREADSALARRLRNESIGLLERVLRELNTRARTVDRQLLQAAELDPRLQTSYREQRFRYLTVWVPPPLSLDAWQQSLAELTAVPEALGYQVQLSVASAARSVLEAQPRRWWLLGATLAALAVGVVLIRRRIIPILARWRGAETPFFQQLGHVVLGLVEHNLLGLAFAASAVIVVFTVQATPPGRDIILTLILLWTGIKLPVNLAWLLLAAPHVPRQRRRPELYRQWRAVLILGGALAAVTILAHLSELPAQTRALFDRLFMLYLLLTVVPVLRVRNLLIQVLDRHYAHQTWLLTLRFISLFLPLSLLVTAALGLIGFLNLAWTASWYVLVFTTMLALWLILQGLLNDTGRWLLAVVRGQRDDDPMGLGDTIRPLHRLLSVLLFSGLLVALAAVYGWDREGTFSTAWAILTLVVVGVIGLYEALLFGAHHLARRAGNVWGLALIRHARKPVGLIMLVATAQLLLPRLTLPGAIVEDLGHFLVMVQIAAVSWLVVQLVSVLDDVMTARYRQVHKTSLGARRTHTQIRVLRQIARICVSILAVGAMLMTFPTIRQLGAGLLASAGAAGLVIGIAARPLFENLIAGIQIGLTQPIRLDDVVIVEGEWGKIAEINATYVVVHIWDDRRLVVPLKYFNEQPFQNWTRTSGELLGTVFLTVDYTFPVDEARQEVKRILEASGMWDGRAWGLQVTDANDRGMELRVLMSAPDAGTAWDLRCLVREKLIGFIQARYPQSLPRMRADLRQDSGARASPPILPLSENSVAGR